MKKWYRFLLIAAVSFSLLLCSVIPVGAATAVQYKGSTWYEVDNFDSVVFTLGDEARDFGYVHLPYSQNYFGDDPPASAHCILYPGGSNGGDGEIEIPSGYFFEVDFQFFITYKTSSSSAWVTLPKKYISSNVAYNYVDSLGEYAIDKFNLDISQKNGSDGRVYNFATKLFVNNTGRTVNVYSFSGGAPMLGSLPSAYAYYVQATKVRYRILSPEQAVMENQNANAEKITNGWTPDPEVPEGSESVGELDSIEQQLQQSSQEGIDAGLNMISGIGDSLVGFQKGFNFLIKISDELFSIQWLSGIVGIGLALGVVAFLLNIVGSVASKISRDQRQAERDRRYAEREASRSKHVER